jgi:PTH1 family peptidyl-tRNA hydrolase
MLSTIGRLFGGNGEAGALIAGLGNPGEQYRENRHNVGFMAIDAYARRCEPSTFRNKFQAQFLKTAIAGREVVLLKPQTFMNRSGNAVQEAMHFYKLPLGKIIVLHDELDLEFGIARIKVGGGLAGHKGLKSIAEQCGGNDFVRLRIGIGRPQRERPEHYVLSDFSPHERSLLPEILDGAAAALTLIVTEGVQAAMNRFNVRSTSTEK